MATRYVSATTARVTDVRYVESGEPSPDLILIYGDEVESDGDGGASVTVTFRGRRGSVKAGALAESPVLEVYFIDVGQGDSTFIVTPQRKKILIDGGINRQALGFLSWKYRLDEPGPAVDIDLMVVTHADTDHLNGLVEVLSEPRIKVRRVVHSGIATFRKGAFDTGLGDKVTVGGQSYLKTRHDDLAGLPRMECSPTTSRPGRRRSCREAICSTRRSTPARRGSMSATPASRSRCSDRAWPPSPGWARCCPGSPMSRIPSTATPSCCVSPAATPASSSPATSTWRATNLLGDPALAGRLEAHVLKAPHHGSSEFAPAFLEAVRPQTTVISSAIAGQRAPPRRLPRRHRAGDALRQAAPLLHRDRGQLQGGRRAADSRAASDIAAVDAGIDNAMAVYRKVFKKRLHGMINVRSDGAHLFAARRVDASYWWESYGAMPVASRSG